MKALILILFAGLLCAQDQKLASVKGVVVNSITGEPLSKATIVIFSRANEAKSREITASARGEFEFNGVDPGTYSLLAFRQGFVEARSSKTVALGAGENLVSIKLLLVPQAVIAGRVLDADGEPLQNVQAEAYIQRWVSGRSAWFPAGKATTNDLGEYRITDLASGHYYVRATFSEPRQRLGAMAEGSKEENYPPVFSPGVIDQSQARPIDVSAGGVRQGVDVRMFKVASHRVRGRVILTEDGDPKPAEYVRIARRSESAGSAWENAPLKPDGTFEFQKVVPGSYSLESASRTAQCQLPIEVRDKDVEGLALHLRPGLSVQVHIRWDGETPVSDAAKKVRLGLRSRGEHGGMMEVAADDSREFKNIASGPGNIALYAPDGAYVKTVRYGGQEVEGDSIDITEGGELEIVMRQGTGSMEGSVEVDDTVVPDAGILLVPVWHRGRHWLYEYGASDQNGHFILGSIAPGDYDAYAFESIDHGSWFDPDFVAKYGRRAERIKIEEKSIESKKLKLIQASDR